MLSIDFDGQTVSAHSNDDDHASLPETEFLLEQVNYYEQICGSKGSYRTLLLSAESVWLEIMREAIVRCGLTRTALNFSAPVEDIVAILALHANIDPAVLMPPLTGTDLLADYTMIADATAELGLDLAFSGETDASIYVTGTAAVVINRLIAALRA